jgi:hypothetical protein
MEASVFLAAFLSTVDVETLTGHDRIIVLQAHQRMASHYLAQTYRDMVAVADAIALEDDEQDPQFATEAAAAEVRAALRLTRRAADIEMEFAIELASRLPAVWDAMCAGDIDARRARVISNAIAHLPDNAARDVVDMIIADAGLLTTGQLRAKLRKLAIEVDPEDAQRRYAQAVEDRRIVAEPTEVGTSNVFGIDLPPHRVQAGMRRVNEIAKSLRGSAETRTMDQLRADVFLDLLEGTGAASNAGNGTVDIRTDLATLVGLADNPGELGGYGPVIADIARQVAERQIGPEWRITITDPKTGRPIDTITTRRRPNRSQQRHVEVRDTTCIFPGCRMPATDCDIDHRVTWAESRTTSARDLAPICRHDHNRVRHRYGWRYQRLSNGDYLWTSRLGHTYTTSGRSP